MTGSRAQHICSSIISILFSLAILIAGAVILSEVDNDDVKKRDVYKWSILQCVVAGLTLLISCGNLYYYLTSADADETQAPGTATGIITLILLIVLVIWGAIIYSNLSDSEKESYEDNFYDLWLFYEITFWYDVVAACLMALCCGIALCIGFCAICASRS